MRRRIAKRPRIGHKTVMSTKRQLVILGGGKGTRLASRLGGLPKPLVDIGGLPLLQRQIEHARTYGVEQVLVLVNHRAECIQEFFRDNENFGLDLICIDDGEPRGTAGAVLAVLPQLAPDVLVMYGDTLLNVDLDRFYAFHEARPDAAASLFLHPNDHPQDSDIMEVDGNGLVTRIYPYPHAAGEDYPNLVNAALYLVRSSALAQWSDVRPPLDFAKDLFPRMVAAEQKLYGYVSPEYIKDVGTPERLDKAEADWNSGRVANGCLSQPQAAVFLDRDGTINKDVGFLSARDQIELLPGAANAVRRINKSGMLSVVVTNQAVVARGDCDEKELQCIHNRLAKLLGLEGAYLDRVFACIHHPDKGFPGERPELKFKCSCRKPAVGLLKQAQEDMNIDFRKCWFVGDRTGDIICGQRAGMRSVLVHTGSAGKDGKYAMIPDYEAADLAEAAEFMLETHPALLAQLAPLAEQLHPGETVVLGGAPEARHFLAVLLRDTLLLQGAYAFVSPNLDETAPDSGTAAVRICRDDAALRATQPQAATIRRITVQTDARSRESFFSHLLFSGRQALGADASDMGRTADGFENNGVPEVRFLWKNGKPALECS